MISSRLFAAAAAAMIVLLPIAVRAQDPRGTILGRITDPSGAVVAGADVRVTNVATGVAAAAKTNEAGNYVLPYLLPGTYTLQTETTGFKKFVREGIQVRVNDTVQVDVQMQIGAATESIQVTGEPQLLSTAEASLGQVVDERRILELPGWTGGTFAHTLLAPGVTNATDLRGRTTGTPAAQSQFSADGVGQYKHEFTIDGVSNAHDQTVGFIPPQLSVGEFKVQTSSFDAAVGYTMGALVNVSTKSGTNDYHGAAHWFALNRVFDAPTIFQNRSGQQLPVYQDNRFGISIGGPVQAPRLYNGKNKTFWFYSWEWNPNTSPDNFINTVPTDAMRRGDLSELLALGATYQVYDPLTTRAAAGGRFQRDPIPNNIIPPSRIDPVAKNILSYWPKPNSIGTRENRNNHVTFKPGSFPDLMHIARVDHAFSQDHRLFVRVHRDSWSSKVNQYFEDEVTGGKNQREKRGIALDEVYVFSPTFFLNFRYGLSEQDHTRYRLSRGFDLASLGLSPRLVNFSSNKKIATFPNVVVAPFRQISDGTDYRRSWLIHSFNGNLTKLRGDHSFRFGADVRVYRESYYDYTYDISPQLSFSSTYTRGPLDSSPAPTLGGEIAAFLLGIPGGQMTRSASYAQQDRYLGLYFQDDFKVTPKLTLNLGLRYELEAPITERFDRSVAGFAFDQSSPIEAQARANYAASPIPELPLDGFRVRGGLTFVNVGGSPRTFWKGEKNNFLPRFGFAYQPRPRTVLRGGYGLFYDSIGINTTDSIQTGFSMSTPIQASLDSGLTYIATMADPFPAGLLEPLGARGGLTTNLGQSVSFFPRERKHPYAQRWSLSVQQLLPGEFLAEAAYVGNRSTRIGIFRNFNALPAQYLSRSPVRDQKTIDFLSQQFPNPFYGTNPIYGRNISRSGLLVPYPQFGGVSMTEPIGYTWYHSLQLRAEKRFSRGYTFQLAYTWAKTMAATSFMNASDPVTYESISPEDRMHRLVMSWIWELPFGRGRRFGAKLPKAVEFFAGGWQFNGMVQRQSGPPLDWGDIWTLFTGNPDDVKLSKNKRSVDRWFNIDAGFNRNSAQQLASNIRVSAPRFSGLRADGQARWDFGLIKSFRVTEKLKAQFRAEAINAWNHPNLKMPSTSPTASTFGMITAQDPPRKWQFALKLMY